MPVEQFWTNKITVHIVTAIFNSINNRHLTIYKCKYIAI